MSDTEAAPGLQIGTIAINRYAAGWIDRDEVEIYPGEGRSRYVLAPPGDAGTQMLVLSGDGGFMTLGARVKKGYDAGLPKEGVESYFIGTVIPVVLNGHVLAWTVRLKQWQSIRRFRSITTIVGHVMEAGDGYMYGGLAKGNRATR